SSGIRATAVTLPASAQAPGLRSRYIDLGRAAARVLPGEDGAPRPGHQRRTRSRQPVFASVVNTPRRARATGCVDERDEDPPCSISLVLPGHERARAEGC